MREFVTAARDALAARNHYAALTLALTLPDMACSLESPDGRTSGAQYATWFDRWVGPRYRKVLDGSDCYALRCALLHNGVDGIEDQKARRVLQRFVFTTGAGNHKKLLDKVVLQLNARKFTLDICEGVEAFLSACPIRARTMTIIDAPHGLLISSDPDGTLRIFASPPRPTMGRKRMSQAGLDPSQDPW
ncbi:hypothetical protein [Bosea sp. BK604]|uniref:hypothetical protein n=1 Tax=Bosea sp. BK604 TaxID=2512180 RepID=UPI001052C6E7|nr:hypothetical protein [Bosea sp. BK604]